MAYGCEVIEASVSPRGDRLTTFQVTYPEMVHNEFLTHRMFSRNASSSRAIPFKRLVQRVIDDPVMPVSWGSNKPGMQAGEELTGQQLEGAKAIWLAARDLAVEAAMGLDAAGVHKQITNRLLQPWKWITVLVTATDYENFFHLRNNADAQPEIQKIAQIMEECYRSVAPEGRDYLDWHLPYIMPEDVAVYPVSELLKLSVARCARVSYETHIGTVDPQKDFALYDRLRSSGHWSPFEHQATPLPMGGPVSNLRGWHQHRKNFLEEYVMG